MPGSENATSLFFSPDSQWVGFFANGKMKKVPVSGGEPTILYDAQGPRGAVWGDDGTIIFAPTSRGGLSRVSAAGGSPQVISTLDAERGETSHRQRNITSIPGCPRTAHGWSFKWRMAGIATCGLMTSPGTC